MPSFSSRTYNAEPEYEFTVEQGTSMEVWRLEPDRDDNTPITGAIIEDTIAGIIGETMYGVYAEHPGKLDRRMPRVNALFQDQVAVNVRIRPVKYTAGFTEVRTEVEFPGLEVEPMGLYTLWDSYDYIIPYALPPYPVVHNDLINPIAFIGYDETGAQYNETYYPEFYRWTIEGWQTREEILKAKYTKQKFRTGSKALPDGNYYQGLTTMALNTEVYTIDWFNVPIRYLRSPKSYLKRHKFTVNQLTFQGYPPGALLFKGAHLLKQYTPPFGDLDPEWGGLAVPASTKLCNLRLEFLACDRVATDPPGYKEDGGTIANKNWIIGGWNVLPNFKRRKFFYSSVDDPDPMKQVPSWLSYPHQMLFQDPDAPGLHP